MRLLNRLAVISLLLACGCPMPCVVEPVTIVVVQCEPRGGSSDCVTVVEFPDGTRRMRMEVWGKVGDKFMAARANLDGWRADCR